VDGIERDVRGRAHVVRVNILSDTGREMRARYGVQYVPTFIVLDSAGREVWRDQGFPNKGEITGRLVGGT
jgi:hypothetical protein